MADPTTGNRGLAIPTKGSNVGTWDVPINGNFSSIDTIVGGVASIGTTGGTTTLNAAQLACGTISITGTLTSDALLVFPGVQGWWTISNQAIVGAFGVFVVCGTQATNIGIPPGEVLDVQIDINTPRYRNLARIGSTEIWAGISSMPRWVSASTVAPYLLCDGGIYNVSSYPFLGAQLGSKFGGNGFSTFGVPDLRGRIPLPYDGTGTRITAGVAGFNGQTIGAAGGDQNLTAHGHAYSGSTGTESAPHTHGGVLTGVTAFYQSPGGATNVVQAMQSGSSGTESAPHTHAYSGTTATVGTGASNNVQPSQVTGIAVIRAA